MLKGGYSAMANLIFQLWLKDIRVHVEDWKVMDRETIQLVKDFTAEHAHNEVEFYMGMVVEDQQTFESLMQHLKNAFQSRDTISELSHFYGQAEKKNDHWGCICRWSSGSSPKNNSLETGIFESMPMSSSKINMLINCKTPIMWQLLTVLFRHLRVQRALHNFRAIWLWHSVVEVNQGKLAPTHHS